MTENLERKLDKHDDGLVSKAVMVTRALMGGAILACGYYFNSDMTKGMGYGVLMQDSLYALWTIAGKAKNACSKYEKERIKLEEREQERIKDLEAKLNITNHFRNEVEVTAEDGRTVTYVGEVFGLDYDGADCIRGGAILTRHDRKWLKLLKWCPLFWFNSERDWTINTGASVTTGYWTHSYFIYHGKKVDCYRKDLYQDASIQFALPEGIKLSTKLLGLIFDPIDAKIMEMYQQGKRTF